MSAIIKVRNLHKTYEMGETLVKALDGVDLDVQEGSFNVAMGPSGSGKSTMMYLLGGLDRPTKGSIEVAGQKLEDLDENELAHFRRETVGFIFQSFNLITSMTAVENVAFPLRFSGMPKRKRQTVAMELLDKVGLADRAGHKPTELSGGQQQRVAVARALVHTPRLILADEPTGNLDTASGGSIMGLLLGLHDAGRTILMVTHDPRMQRFATNTIHMLDGHIVDDEVYKARMEAPLMFENAQDDDTTEERESA